MRATRCRFLRVSQTTGTNVSRRGPRRCAPIVTTLEDRAMLTGMGSVPITPPLAGPPSPAAPSIPDRAAPW